MKKNRKVKTFKLIIAILVIALISAIIIYLFPIIKKISTSDGQAEFKRAIDNSGIWGVLALFGLQLAQIFLIIIPGEPIEILAGMCYGGFWGTVFVMISACIISSSIFLLVRKFGKKFVYNFCNKEKVKKIENNKLFQNPRKIETIIFILFFLPGTPKDLLVYVSGLLPIKPIRFILISTFARLPSIITSTVAGENILEGNWKIGILFYLGIILLVLIAVFIANKFDKDKIAEKTIDSMK